MFLRLRVLVVAATMLVLLGGFVAAQVLRERVPVRPPIVLSGADVGFQITQREGTTPVGNVVVQVDGKWVPVKFESGPARLSTR
jgi:hypothetical protein